MTAVVMDLRAMCAAIRPLLLDRSVTAAPPRLRVEPLSGRGGPLTVAPLPVTGYIDGVQATRLLTVRAGDRPVYLVGVAAGLMDPEVRRVRLGRWRIALVCSYLDEAWAHALPAPPCEVVSLEQKHPDGLDLEVGRWVDAARRSVEQQVVAESVVEEQPGRWTVVDGSLAGVVTTRATSAPRLIGVVKSCGRQYLNDEHLTVHPLREGEVSAPFLLPGERRGQLDRASCYLCQRDRAHRPWTFGLVRVEVPAEHAAALPAAAATVLAGRQASGGDARWDRQQAWVARLEDALHSSLPYPLRA